MNRGKFVEYIQSGATSSRTTAEVQEQFGELPHGRLPRGIVKDGDVYKVGTAAPKKATKRAKKHARKPRRLQGFKAERRKLQQLAKKHTRRPAAPDAPAMRDIALANYMAIVDGLIATVRHEVEDIDNCPPLATQLANVDRAKQLFQAAA